jgi:hypothetical protein
MPSVDDHCEMKHTFGPLSFIRPLTATRAAMQRTTNTDTLALMTLPRETPLPPWQFVMTVACASRQAISKQYDQCCDTICKEPVAMSDNLNNDSSSTSSSSNEHLGESNGTAQAHMLHVQIERFAKIVRQHEVWNRNVTEMKAAQSPHIVNQLQWRKRQQPQQQQHHRPVVGSYTELRKEHERKRTAAFTDGRRAKWRRCSDSSSGTRAA